MKIFGFIIGIILLLLIGVSFPVSILIITITWLVVHVVEKLNESNQQESPNNKTSIHDGVLFTKPPQASDPVQEAEMREIPSTTHPPSLKRSISHSNKGNVSSYICHNEAGTYNESTIKETKVPTSSQLYKNPEISNIQGVTNIVQSLANHKNTFRPIAISEDVKRAIGNIIYVLLEHANSLEIGTQSDDNNLTIERLSSLIKNIDDEIYEEPEVAFSDDSRVDVTGESYTLEEATTDIEVEEADSIRSVSYREHTYIYSANSLETKVTISARLYKNSEISDMQGIANIVQSLANHKSTLRPIAISEDVKEAIGNIIYLLLEHANILEIGTQPNDKSLTIERLRSLIEDVGEIYEEPEAAFSDDSIIDVTGESYILEEATTDIEVEEEDSISSIPYWEHAYIYSTNSLKWSATDKIRKFYSKFKKDFLNGKYHNLNGNTNYSFTLMFDILDEYEKHKNLTLLSSQILSIIEHYPETESYAEQNLIEQAKKSGKRRNMCGENETNIDDIIELFPDSREWTFVDKYINKLNLTNDECELLEYFETQWGSFFSYFEFMKVKHVELFRDAVKAINEKYISEDSSFDKVLSDTANSFNIKTRHGRYHPKKSIYIYDNLHSTEKIKMVYNCIFRYCRNKLYDWYDLNCPVEIFSHDHTSKSKNAITQLLQEIESTVDSVVELMPDFTEDEEIIINKSYSTRWRGFYQKINASFDGDLKDYSSKVARLAKQNSENSGLKHLLFDVTKFLVGKDNIAALKMYLEYVNVYHKFENDTEKPLPKYICKKLFKKPEQQEEFEQIVSQYKCDKDMANANRAIELIFLPKRKKLDLNQEKIEKTTEKFSKSVKLLNEVLSEEEFPVVILDPDKNIVEPHYATIAFDCPTNTLMDSLHLELLDIFVKNNHSLTKKHVEVYAKSKGLMANRLIDKINELCYDALDDVLIEDEDDSWTIMEEYLRKIVT